MYHEVTVVVRPRENKPWKEVGFTYCGKEGCEECRIIEKLTQKGNRSRYDGWKARVRHELVFDTPIPDKQYRIWVVEFWQYAGDTPTPFNRNGHSRTNKYVIEVIVEHWSALYGKWCYDRQDL